MFKPKSEPGPGPAKVEPADPAQLARVRARHRLIGAAVLLVVAVIAFPLVFETQPRPIPVDIPIEIPRRDGAPPLVMPPAAPTQHSAAMPASAAVPAPMPVAASMVATAAVPSPSRSGTEAPAPSRPAGRPPEAAMLTESPADAGRDVAPPSPRAAGSAVPTATSRAAEGQRAQAILEGRSANAAVGEAARFVVQVGAFADADAARETRKNVEKLGLKTYTQVAQTAAGSRIRVRVGPFATRADAEAALAKAKAAGLAAVLLTL